MAINLNDLANALTGAQERPAAPRASRDQYGTIALDAEGTPTVMLDGGTDYAPCTCMVGVHHGDRVLAHVVNHKIVVFANITAPTTDDATALVAIDRADVAAEAADAAGIAAASAQQFADAAATAASVADGKAVAAGKAASAAQQSADAAQQSADDASAAAQNAWNRAGDAATAAQNAWNRAGDAATAASNAQQSADRANVYSTAALDQLGVVQDVAGILTWASEHGSFAKTSDTAIQDGKVYFVKDGADYAPVVDPQAADLASYYELTVDEPMNDFIMAHLAVTNRGLWVLPAGKGSASDEQHAAGYKMLLASDGCYIYDGSGVLVRSDTASGTDFAEGRSFHFGSENEYILYTPASGSTPASLVIGGANVQLGSSKTLSQWEADMQQAVDDAAAALDSANSANAREQRIFKTAASGTASMAATTTWITSTADAQNAWTAKRPSYDRSYPVLFTATQRQTVAQQAAGSTCSCTTPYVDESAAVAGNYITKVSTGGDAWVHSEGHGPDANGNATANTYGWRIGSVFELVRAGLSYLKMWVENSVAKVRVGLESAGHSVFSSDGMEVFVDEDTSVAEFSKDGARIGDEESPHIEIESNRFSAIGTEGSSVFEVVSSGTVATRAVKFAVSPKTGYEYIARPWAGVGVKEDATNLTTDDYVIVESDEVTLPQLAAGTKIVVRYRVMYFDPFRSGRYVELAQYETIAGTSNQKSLIPPVRQVVFSVGTARSFDVFTVADRSSSEQTFKGIVYNGGTSLKVILPDLQDGGGAQLITVTDIRYYLPTNEVSYYSIGSRGSGQVDPAAMSTAVGNELISSSQSQAVFGEYNLEDAEDDYALIIGDGTSDSARSNSAVIHKNGGAYISRSMAGFVQMYAGVDLPVGWLWCNGDLVKVSDYPELYEAMGGNKHFNRYDNDIPDGYFRLPDFRGRAPIGVGLGDSNFTHRFLGEEVGAETHTLTGPQSGIQAHSAAVAANWYISTYKGKRSSEVVGGISGTGWEISQVESSGGSWSGQNSISIAAKNATQAHNNMQPSLAINFIICTGKTY